MAGTRPLQRVLNLSRGYWDRDRTRAVVRHEFHKVIACRTLALGGEIFRAQCGEELIVPHTCKSRMCPSCGQRNNLQWLRERWSALPEIPYSHVVLTMPDHFWLLFRENRHLLNDLPSLGAAVIQQGVRKRYGATLLVAVIPHSFGRDLKFNCHLHLMVSQGGLSRDETTWLPDVRSSMPSIMRMWRYAVTTFLQRAHQLGLLTTELTQSSFARLLDEQSRRQWHTYRGDMRSKGQILRYAGRYARRPPLAEHRLRQSPPGEVCFVTKDLKKKRTIETSYSLEAFVERLAHHVPDWYTNSVRYYGLLAPRAWGRLSGLLFRQLGQRRRPKPVRLPWASAVKKYFGTNPLEDVHGHSLFWTGRVAAGL